MNSDQNAVSSEAATLVGLRKLAKDMHINFHPNIGVAKLIQTIVSQDLRLNGKSQKASCLAYLIE